MKKTLAAVAVLGAFAGSALAADVTLYGRVNLGVNYVHTDDGSTTSDSWSLNSGDATGSRFGLKGVEEISEGLKVGFQLEQGFNADDGAESESDKAFRREARLYVATDYGTLHMGRFGALDSAAGSLDMVGGLSSMGTGYGDIIGDQGRVFKTYGRMNNSIAYTSPEFAGMKLSAMVSLGDNNSEFDKVTNTNGKWAVAYDGEGEATHNVDRYYGLGVNGQWGALGAGLVVSMLDKGNDTFSEAFSITADDELKAVRTTGDDGYNVTAGTNYDFGVAKVFLAGNYYKAGKGLKLTSIGGAEPKAEKTDVHSWGVSTSVEAPLAAGTFQAAVAYGVKTDDAKAKDQDTEILNVGAFYKYPLSKRTYVYAGAGYDQEKADGSDTVKTYEVISGIAHHF